MTRPGRRTAAGLAALGAAVADARADELRRAARLGAVAAAGDRARVAGTSRLTPAAAAAGGAAAPLDEPADLVPSPSTSREQGAVPDAAPAEGDAALALALVQRAQAGDAEAFGELYDRYVDLVYRYVYYRVGTSQVAEDLTSETFLRALRRIGSFTWQGRDVGAWFVTIARNLIADHYKSGRYRLELTTDDVSRTADGGGSADALVAAGPEGAVLEQLSNEALLGAVKQLGSEQQECIVLRFLQGLSVAETAAVMGKNDGAIKALQYRAVRSLARLLPEGFEL